MPSNGRGDGSPIVDRRRVLQAIGAASAVGLAGCGGTGDQETPTETETDDGMDGNGNGAADLGERVPTLVLNYWSDQGAGTVAFEETIAQLEPAMEELGIRSEPEAMTTAQSADIRDADERGYHIGVHSNGPDPARLDPDDLLQEHHIEGAGPAPDNAVQYANCEFSQLVEEQAVTVPIEDRREVVDSAFEIFSADFPFIPTIERPATAALNLDQLTEVEAGAGGLSDINWTPVLESELTTKGGTDTIIASLPGEFLTSSFYPTVADGDALILNTVLTNSPLLMYNSDFERIPVLAESWESSDDGLSHTFHLRDATFHNGDPVTPEDVKWTYEFINEKYHEGTYSWTRMPETMSVEVVDDSTVRFSTEEPAPTLLTSQLPAFGVLPRDPYLDAGIEDNPVDFEDPMIGAGPFSIESYRNQESIELAPHDGHPVWSPSDPIIALTFDSVDSTVRALQEGEINLGTALTPEAGQRLEESMDNVQVISGVAHVCYGLFPQMSFGPCKFHEFREALGYMLDREAINETYALGTSEPITHATFQSKYHPWTDLDVLTECGTAGRDVEQARTLLEEAGWGWDDNGNLHYPPGAELEAWPQGEGPSPEEYPCLEG